MFAAPTNHDLPIAMAKPLLISLLDEFIEGLMSYTKDLADGRSQFVWREVTQPDLDLPQEAECKLSVHLRSQGSQRKAYAVVQVIEDEELTFTVRCLGVERTLPLHGENLTRVYEEVTRKLEKKLTSPMPS